jgi:biotin--protein ligase
MPKDKILVYQDEGTSPYCVYETLESLKLALNNSLYLIETTDSKILNNQNWEADTALLIIPGGQSLPFYNSLSGNGRRGNDKINRYVEEGGNYLGICAGAYYGSAITDFERGGPLESLFYGPLNFFKGKAEGPAYGLRKFVFNSDEGAEAACVSWCDSQAEQQAYKVYFNGGSYFADAEAYEGVKILARYNDIENNPAAIIKCNVGRGCSILSGVHIEYSYKSILPTDKIYSTIKDHDAARQQLFSKVINQFGLQLTNDEVNQKLAYSCNSN